MAAKRILMVVGDYVGYPTLGPDLKLAGANYVELPWDRAMVDGNLVTAPGWGAVGEWIGKFLTVLGTKVTA
ncbi:MAG: hypothetical protein ACYC9Q_08460 [Bacillota bacterium]